jgi:hypothetical protein
MGKTPRERVILTLLPAIIAVCGYLLFFSRDKELKAAVEALESARSAQVEPSVVYDEQLKLDDLQDESSRLKGEKSTLSAQKRELAAIRETVPSARTDALRQLSRMLWARGLHPFNESGVEETDSKTAPSFDSVIKALAPPTPPPNLFNPESAAVETPASKRLWQIQFYGRYGDVVSALESLRDSGLPIIPVSLTMSEARRETAWRSWTLLIWL